MSTDPIPIVLETVDNISIEAQIYRDSNRNLVVMCSSGFNLIFKGESLIDVAQKMIDVLRQP